MSAAGWIENPVASEADLIDVRRHARELATRQGFSLADVTRIVTAASELARNILQHTPGGTMRSRLLESGVRAGIELIFTDKGPGIADIDQAMQEGFSTGRGLGLGLPGTKRLMDEMVVRSEPGAGTTVTIRKWQR